MKLFEEYIEELEAIASDTSDPAKLDALEAAQDALAWSQALWDLFSDQHLHRDGDTPDFCKMENLVDALNGELAAAVLFLNSLDISAEEHLRKNASLLASRQSAGDEAAQAVPKVIIDGNRRLAKRIENTKIVLAAQKTQKITRPSKKP